MITKLIQTVKNEKKLLASVISDSDGLNKKDKTLSRYGLSENQIEKFDYDAKVNEYLNQYIQEKIVDNTTEEKSFKTLWEKLSFADRKLMVEKLKELGEINLSEQLSDKIVLFSDILELPDSVIKKLLEKTNYNTLMRSLKNIKGDYFSNENQEQIREKIYSNLESSKVEQLKEDLYFMGPVRKRDILEARKMICKDLQSFVN